jgi:putative endonuclease
MFHWLRKLFGPKAVPNAGHASEQLAAAWLRRERGFTLVARNWRNPRDLRDELDLVCQDGEVLVFIEVKARAAEALVPGYYAVDRRKKRVLQRAIKAYLAQLRTKPRTFRFDIVEVALPSEVRYFENVPLFSKHFQG